MKNSRLFWAALIAATTLVYAAALKLVLDGSLTHWLVIFCGVLLVAHAFEIPMALRKLKQPAGPRNIVLILLYGILWWVPASRGLFSAK